MIYEKNLNIKEKNWTRARTFISAETDDNRDFNIPVTHHNHLIVGVPGGGKTVFTCALLDARKMEEPDTFCVFFQTKPDDFTGRYLTDEDKVIVATDNNKFSKKQIFKWNLLEEVRQAESPQLEIEELATIFFADFLEDKKNIVWADAAKQLFKAYILTILYLGDKLKLSNRELVYRMLDGDYNRLFKFLSLYPPNRSMLMNNFSYDGTNPKPYQITKKGQDILFFYTNVLLRFQSNFLSDSGEDTIQAYLNGMYGRNLFFLYDYRHRNTSKVFFSYFLKKLIAERVSLTGNYKQAIIFVLDEIDKLGSDIGLLDAVNLGRQFGISCIVSTQSAESLFLSAPERQTEHYTKASYSGFGAIVAFQLGDGNTRDMIKQIFGNVKRETMIFPYSRYDKPIVKIDTEPLVSDTDFSNLDVGEFYIKIGASQPKRLKLKLEG